MHLNALPERIREMSIVLLTDRCTLSKQSHCILLFICLLTRYFFKVKFHTYRSLCTCRYPITDCSSHVAWILTLCIRTTDSVMFRWWIILSVCCCMNVSNTAWTCTLCTLMDNLLDTSILKVYSLRLIFFVIFLPLRHCQFLTTELPFAGYF